MASRTLRPLSIGEILDAGIKVFVRHWKVLTLCVVALVLPLSTRERTFLTIVGTPGRCQSSLSTCRPTET